MRSAREWVQDTINSGTVGGLALGSFYTAFTAAVAVGAFWQGGVFLVAVGVVAAATSVNRGFSCVASFRRRRTGRRAASGEDTAGEQVVAEGLERGALWARVLVGVFGAAVTVVGAALLVGLISGEQDLEIEALVAIPLLIAGGLYGVAVGLRRRPARAAVSPRRPRRRRRRRRRG